jgi:hypothetical protein
MSNVMRGREILKHYEWLKSERAKFWSLPEVVREQYTKELAQVDAEIEYMENQLKGVSMWQYQPKETK